MDLVVFVVALASQIGQVSVIQDVVDFDLAKLHHRKTSCRDEQPSDDIIVCARRGMHISVSDPRRFAARPLRAQFNGPLQAETVVHVIQQRTPVFTSPVAAVSLKWHF